MNKLLIAVCFLFTFMLAGCDRRPVETPTGCKYVYEKRPNQKPEVKANDYVAMFFSATGDGKLLLEGPVHNFAVFAKMNGDKVEESVTISWFPRSMKFNPIFPQAEQGLNADLPTTLSWARTNKARVERVGPFYVKEELYEKAKNQAARLNSGFVQYKSIDTGLRPDSASNSVHAISDILCKGDGFDVFLVRAGNGTDASLILKSYFEREGYLNGKYQNDKFLKQFDLQYVRHID